MTETVAQPDYYNHGGYESIINGVKKKPLSTMDYIEKLMLNKDVTYSTAESIYVFNIIKYLSRFPFKSDELDKDSSYRVEDLKKAQWYANRLYSLISLTVEPTVVVPISDNSTTEKTSVSYEIPENSATELTSEYIQGLLDGEYFTGTEAYYVSSVISGLTYYGVQVAANRKNYLSLLINLISDLITYETAYVGEQSNTTAKAPESTESTVAPDNPEAPVASPSNPSSEVATNPGPANG